MKPHFAALLALGVLPLCAFAQEVNFDDLRRAGTPLVKSYTISGAGAEGSGAVMKFGDIDTQRVEEHNARRRSYTASGGGGVSTSSVPYSSSSTSGSVAPASAPTWTIANKKSYFEVKCSNMSYAYSVSACGNRSLFDMRGFYREGMGGCHYKSVEQAARELCTR